MHIAQVALVWLIEVPDSLSAARWVAAPNPFRAGLVAASTERRCRAGSTWRVSAAARRSAWCGSSEPATFDASLDAFVSAVLGFSARRAHHRQPRPQLHTDRLEVSA